MPRQIAPTPATREQQQPRYDDAELIEPKRMPEPSRRKGSDELELRGPSASPNDEELLGNDYLLDSADPTPPPSLRKRQPGDRPLGELPSERSERSETKQSPKSEDLDSLLPMDEESFELVPNPDLPPVTQRRSMPMRYSTKALPVSARNAWNDRIHEQTGFEDQRYTDYGYSYRRTSGTAAAGNQSDRRFTSPVQNRFK